MSLSSRIKHTSYQKSILPLLVCLLLILGMPFAFADDSGIHKASLTATDDSTYTFRIECPVYFKSDFRNLVPPHGSTASRLKFTQNGSLSYLECSIKVDDKALFRKGNLVLSTRRKGIDLSVKTHQNQQQRLVLRSAGKLIIPLAQIIPEIQSGSDLFLKGLLYYINKSFILMLWLSFCFILILTQSNNKNSTFILIGVLVGILCAEFTTLQIPYLFNWMLIAIFSLVLSTSYFTKNVQPKYVEISTAILFTIWAFYFSTDASHITTEAYHKTYFSLGLLSASALLYLGILILANSIKTDLIKGVLVKVAAAFTVFFLVIFFTQKLPTHYKKSSQELDFKPQVDVVPNLTTAPPLKAIRKQAKCYIENEQGQLKLELILDTISAKKIIQRSSRNQTKSSFSTDNFTAFIQSKLVIRSSDQSISASEIETFYAKQYLNWVELFKLQKQSHIGVQASFRTPDSHTNYSIDFNWLTPQVDSLYIFSASGSPLDTLFNGNATLLYEFTKTEADKAYNNTELKAVKLPLVSFIGLVFAIVILIFIKWKYKHTVAIGIVIMSILFTVFYRSKVHHSYLVLSDKQKSDELIEQLIANVYYAFNERDKEITYDKLSNYVIGEALNQIYLQNRQSLLFEKQGGAKAKVKNSNLLEKSPIKNEGYHTFSTIAQWQVSGNVLHFGHRHYRTNVYTAKIYFTLIEKQWKISNIEYLDLKRVL